jgi:hypothetical protein
VGTTGQQVSRTLLPVISNNGTMFSLSSTPHRSIAYIPAIESYRPKSEGQNTQDCKALHDDLTVDDVFQDFQQTDVEMAASYRRKSRRKSYTKMNRANKRVDGFLIDGRTSMSILVR